MNKKEFIFPALLALFCVISNFIWLGIDTVPQAWDESLHLQAAAAFADTMKHSPVKAMADFVTQENYYPPLVPFIAAFFGLGNPDMDSFTRSMLLFHILLIFSVFACARRRFDFLSACVAASLTMAFPLIYVQGHLLMLDLPLTAFVMLTVYLLSGPEVFKSRRSLIILGAVAGAAMLVKWTYWIYVAVPFIFRLVGEKKENPGAKIKGFGGFFLAAFLIAGPWYLWHAFPIISKLLEYSFSRGKTEGLPSVLSFASLKYYFIMLPKVFNPALLLICFSGIIMMFVKKDKKNMDLLVYFLVPVLFMTLLQNKKDRYIMPALPFMAVAGSYLIYSLKSRVKEIAIVVSAFAVLSYSFAVFPFGFPWPQPARPVRADWKITEMLDKAAAPGMFVIVPDVPGMNNINYGFYIKNFYPHLKVSGIYNFPMFADYFLIKTGSQGPVFTASDKREVITRQAVENNGPTAGYFEKIHEADLPDGSTAMLYKRKDRILVDGMKFKTALNAEASRLLGMYLKGPENLKFVVSSEKYSALVKSLRVSFDRAYAGDFEHKDAGLLIRNADIEIQDLLVNPRALYGGEFSILSMGAICLHSVEVNETDLAAFAAIYAKGAKDINVKIRDGNITLSAAYGKTKIEACLKLYNPSKENPDIAFRIISLKAGMISVPAWLANFLIKDYNPLFNRSGSPIKINYGDISAIGGILTIK